MDEKIEVLVRRVRSLERTVATQQKSLEESEARCTALESLLFEERQKSAQQLRTLRERCLSDAVEVCSEFVAPRLKRSNVLGEPLKETLVAVFHGHGIPPLAPTEALPAALACVDVALAQEDPGIVKRLRDLVA